MFKNKFQPLSHPKKFVLRIIKSSFISMIIIVASLGMGILGYHFICKLGWLDALLNASMILTGMGPVNLLTTKAGKLFASFYALFSGIAFLTGVSVIISPFLHRFLHKFHIEVSGS